MVLDHIDRTPIPSIEPHEILFAKLRELRTRGPINVAGKGSGRFGLGIEAALGIPQNSAKAADFMGIELKVKSDNTLQTLFSRTPSRFVEDIDKTAMFRRHSYHDKTGRRALYTSFNNSADTLGFRLVPDALVIRVTRNETTVLEYDTERLEEALLSKHSQTAFITVGRCVNAGTEACTLEQVTYCKWPSIIRFMRLVGSGDVSLDFTMSHDVISRGISCQGVPSLLLASTGW